MSNELPRGYREKSAAEMAADAQSFRDSRPTVTRCCIPPCRGGVLHVGAAADGREAARLHRERRHPDHQVAERRRPTQEQQRERAMLASAWKRKRFQGLE